MKRYALAVSSLLLLAACVDATGDPMQPRDMGPPAASRAGPVLTGGTTGDPAPAGTTSATVVLDFESLASGGVSMAFVPSYSQDGFTLVNPDYAGSDAFGAPLPGSPYYQGSIGLVEVIPAGVTLLTRDDGGTFTAASIDIAELDPADVTPREIPFTGTRADGSTVTATFTTDGVAGFETFAFDGFTDLVSLSWVQGDPPHMFDNVTLDLPASGPGTKADCWNGGWEALGFRNQGQCIRMVETGKDSR